MIITKLNVTFNPESALLYCQQVKSKFPQLKWQIPSDFHLEPLRPIHGWSLTIPKDGDPTKPFGLFQSIDIMGKENYQETELVFGFGKSVVDLFSMAYRFSIGVSPPGVHVEPHTDGGNGRDALRGWMSIVTDPSIKWITKEGVADLAVGNVYIIDITQEHEFINEGDTTGIGLVFDIRRSDFEAIKQIKGIIN
jgi:hypothetical protein